jgi:hypothetical protein
MGWKIIGEESPTIKQQPSVKSGKWRIAGPALPQEDQSQEDAGMMQKLWQEYNKPRFEMGAPGAVIQGLEEGIGGVSHGALQPILESGIMPERISEASKKTAQERLGRYLASEKAHPLSTKTGRILGGAAASLPIMAATRGMGTLGSSTVGGGVLGGLEYVHPGESRAKNALIGSALGFGTPLALGVVAKPATSAVKEIQKLFGKKSEVAKDVLQGLPQEEVASMIAAEEAGKRLGLKLTPAEASGNPLLGRTEGRMGVTPETEQSLYSFKKGQKEAQRTAVEKLKSDISPSEKVFNAEARDTAKSIIDKKKQALQKKASPFYEKSYKHEIPENEMKSILKDSNIKKAYKEVISDPLYKSELKGFKKGSIKVLDQVKKNLDDKINNLYRNGYDEKARIMSNARKKLVNSLDKASPEYGKARKIYSEDLPAIKSIEESKIGKIANMSDDQVKNVSKTIFDPNETDMKTFLKLRNEMVQENPEVWRGVVKNEMERRLSGSKSLKSTGSYGSEFYNSVLARDKDFKKFYAALGNPKTKGITPEQKKLVDMRKAFKNLINSRTVKTAAGQSETKMNLPRSTAGAVMEFYNKFVKGKYDKAAVEIITDPNWKKYLPEASKKVIKGDAPKNPNELMEALVALEVSAAVKPDNSGDI